MTYQTITPELVKQHGLTPEEYERIKGILGREPSYTELGIFSVMWSEHCSYKNTRPLLKGFPTKSPRILVGAGEENAGIIDIGDGIAIAFKILMSSATAPARQNIYIVGLFVLAVLSIIPTALRSDPLDCWHWRNPRPHALQLYALAHGNGIWVGVGGRGGVAVTSVDGVQWDYSHVNTSRILGSVAYGNGSFIASSGQLLFQSGDGHSWWALTNLALGGLLFANGKFIGVNSGALWFSPEGTNWQSVPFPWQSLSFANGVFFGIQYSTDQNGVPTNLWVYTSTNLTNWSNGTKLGSDGVRQILYGNGVYVGFDLVLTISAVKTVFRYSTDGVVWSSPIIFDGSQIAGCVFVGGEFIAVDAYGYVLKSSDGATWDKIPAPELFAAGTLAAAEGTIVCGGLDGRLVSSFDSMHWVERSIGNHNSLAAITDGGGELVAVGGRLADEGASLSRTVILRSTNGRDWDEQLAPTSSSLTAITKGTNGYVAVGQFGAVLSSSTTGNWTAMPRLTSNNLYGVAFGNGSYVAVGGDSRQATVLASPDGANWTNIAQPTNFPSLRSVTYGNGRFVAVGLPFSSEQPSILTSADGIQWNGFASYHGFYVAGYGNGVFVAAGDRGTILISTNASDWQNVTFLPSNTALSFLAFGYGNGWYMLGGSVASLYTSRDGRTWLRRQAFPDTTYLRAHGFAYGGNSLFVVGFGGQVLESDPFVPPQPELLLACRFLSGPILTLAGPECTQYQIEYADDLSRNSTWQPFTTVSNINGPINLRVAPGQNGTRFYRARSQP